MTASFNLLTEPWIPCIQPGVRGPEPLSLRDTLVMARDIREIYHDSPLTVAALHRLLLAVVHRVFGPKDRDVWADLWKTERWNEQELDNYFDSKACHGRFGLFDEERPFYQVRQLPPEVKNSEERTISVLALHEASGNNSTLFDHHMDPKPKAVTPAEAALRVVTTQAFALGGGNSGIPGNNYKKAVCASGAFILVEGENLFQTLLLSMRRYPHTTIRFKDDPDIDKPAWEMDDPFDPERDRPHGYLDFLTWQSRRIKLLPEENPKGLMVRRALMTQGMGLHKKDVRDPLMGYKEDNKGNPWLIKFDPERALWRDSMALLTMQELKNKDRSSPENFILLATLARRGILKREKEKQFRYLAFGMAPSESGAGSALLWRYERMPLPLQYLSEQDMASDLRRALHMAETVSYALENARDWLVWHWLYPNKYSSFKEWKESKDYVACRKAKAKRPSKGEDKKFRTVHRSFPITRHYWWRLDAPFRDIFTSLVEGGADQARLKWREELRKVARTAFREVTHGIEQKPRSLRALVEAKALLELHMGRTLKKE